ncbi:outer membrane lipid asymmetry maintenance protein MlaD [Luteimonas deserti]|uniref:Outer membrane lipid asymmetry maintenance protein MlaD n=1 Tax=Luteimonas deserti TaxID=2752306 RepID=A0A7Z0TV81_9GAMM|nr:outer membrane lipid asymmetry maintenance protein MlaD [Luteimonas deserti]NYZ61969.1 outer membrane lipid asymmetry maintenance protein MlaD [Luteimonas deserti]
MTSARGPRLEFAVGAFLLLALASLLVLAMASTNGQFGFVRGGTYELSARFSNLGQLRPNAPVKIGGVTIGRVSKIDLDPVRFDSIVTLAVQERFNEIPADTSAAILTGGLLGESYVGLSPGGDLEALQPGEEIAFTSPAVDLIQMVGKYMFSGGGADAGAAPSTDDPYDTASPDASPRDEGVLP